MKFLGNAMVFLVSYVVMEFLGGATHKYVMHGPLWRWHRGHHHPSPDNPRFLGFEPNDSVGLFYSVLSIILIARGVKGRPVSLFIGLGITAWGLSYFLLHDCLVHRRLGGHFRPKNRYLRRIVAVHRLHHANREKEGGRFFGFVYAPSLPDRPKKHFHSPIASASVV